jgi:predicted metal-dependent phosphoesterase TrpH
VTGDLLLGQADLHVHTTCSDGHGTPEQVASALAGGGLAVAAVTDHDSVEGALRVREALAGFGPEIVVGSEITTADGHLLALFVERDVPAGLGAAETIDRIHARGGLAVAPHPYFPVESLGDLAGRLPFDAVEVANGTPLGELANWRARRRLGAGARARVGGSDAHVVAAVGHVRTLFPGRTAADLRLAIERGETRPAFDWAAHLRMAPIHLRRSFWSSVRAVLLPRRAVDGPRPLPLPPEL